MRVDQGSEFYNSPFKKWLKENHIDIHSTYYKEKSVVAGRFIWNLKNNIGKHMKGTSKKVYFDIFNDIYDKYNNTQNY